MNLSSAREILKNVFFPFDEPRPIGGPSTFLYNLKHWFLKNDITWCRDLSSASVLFSPFFFDANKIEKHLAKGGKLVARLDGAYYPSRHGHKHTERNQFFSMIYHLATHIVFQSDYAKRQYFTILGELPANKYSIIHNGANGDMFYPKTISSTGPPWIFATTGNFRHIDMIEPIILAVRKLRTLGVEAHIIFIGPIIDELYSLLFDCSFAKHIPATDLYGVAHSLRKAHVFLYTFLNPPCPNSVIEAASIALPVVGFRSGALPELLFHSTELLADVGETLFQTYDQFDIDKLVEKLLLVTNYYNDFRYRSLRHRGQYAFNRCAYRYLEVLKSVSL